MNATVAWDVASISQLGAAIISGPLRPQVPPLRQLTLALKTLPCKSQKQLKPLNPTACLTARTEWKVFKKNRAGESVPSASPDNIATVWGILAMHTSHMGF